jgi:carboxyl-terminal processing protease
MRWLQRLSAASLLGAGAVFAQSTAPVPPSPSLYDLARFAEAYARVKAEYVDSKDDRALIDLAIAGMLRGLDAHTEFLPPAALANFESEMSGRYVGVGMDVEPIDGKLVVIAPIDRTPAARAGIQPSDEILSIDGRQVTAETASDAADWLRGEPGSVVTLELKRNGELNPLTVKLTRERIRIGTVELQRVGSDVLYARISSFQEDTDWTFVRALERAQREAPARGLLLDLRDNPGGIVDTAIGVADALLDDGVIVSTKARRSEASSEFRASPGDVLNAAPIAVLTSAGTASAAEIVAGALKDNRRATVVGERTFGKGSVQSVIALSDGAAIKLTTARYYTPGGTSIQAQGIVPDVALRDRTLSESDRPAMRLREADLAAHLKNPDGGPDDVPALEVGNDYALDAALHVLEGLIAARSSGVRSR